MIFFPELQIKDYFYYEWPRSNSKIKSTFIYIPTQIGPMKDGLQEQNIPDNNATITSGEKKKDVK